MHTKPSISDSRTATPSQCCIAILIAAAVIIPSACAKRPRAASRLPSSTASSSARIGNVETGIASWYGEPYDGRRTASGEIYDMQRWTAAHRTLPFHTWVEVRNLHNGEMVQVRINDRGPFVGDRVIDLSKAAAEKIRMIGPGTARVRLTIIQTPSRSSASAADLPKFAVQVGSFRDQAKALQLRDRLRSQHEPVEIVTGLAPDTVWRVLVGSEPDPYRAALLASSLRQEFPDSLVINMDAPGPSVDTDKP